MHQKLIMFFFGAVISVCVLFTSCMSINPVNDRPIIGIVTEEVNSTFVPNAKSDIYASYVKFLEAGGARVVPVMIYKSKQYYRDLLSKINGVLFPGGGNILRSKGYGRTGKLIFDIATEMNDKGDFFPLWGTCLGFELLNYLAAKKLWMKACAAEDLPSNLNFIQGFKNSRMFQDLDVPLQKSMQNENVTINYHQWCLTPQNYTLSELNKYFKVLALSQDSRNLTYVSVVEGYKYPYYGVAFHPEKVMFEWVLSKTHHNIPHNAAAIRVSQYFANFFVNEARKSTHKFPNKEMEDAVLIYNYNPVFTGKCGNNPVVQNYYFT